jgi:hypothetical protein
MSARPPGGTCPALVHRSLLCRSTAVCSSKRRPGRGGSSPRTRGQRVDPSATGSPCAPCRTRHWSPRTWSRQPPQPALTDLKEPRSAGRSTVRDAGAPSCTPVARRGSAPVYPLIGYLRGSFRPPARVWRTPGRRPAFPVPACSWRAECPDLDGQCRNGHRADTAQIGGSSRGPWGCPDRSICTRPCWGGGLPKPRRSADRVSGR